MEQPTKGMHLSGEDSPGFVKEGWDSAGPDRLYKQLGMSGWVRASIMVGDIRHTPQSLVRRNRRETSQGSGSQAKRLKLSVLGFLTESSWTETKT